jgi:O-acetyl-ADP-ribose deacetylase (regulator of RNase III)
VIEWKRGDLLAEPAEALVNAVNFVGVMSRGIALQFKRAFPDNFAAYRAACARGEVLPGRMFVFERSAPTLPRFIANFPTKRHWRDRSRIDDIDAGLLALADEIGARAIRSIATPALGAGLGGLAWSEVRERIAHELGELDGVRVIVFEPHENE